MRTLIRASWVVGYEGGQHQVIRDGVCVVEDDHILHVGKSFDGQTDRVIEAPGRLISPGFISTHQHAVSNSIEYVYLDRGAPELQTRNYLNGFAAVKGKERPHEDWETSVTWALGVRLRSGCTTLVDLGAPGSSERFVGLVDKLGIRTYTGPMYLNESTFFDEEGRIVTEWHEERGMSGLRAALAFAEKYDGSCGGRVKAILCPGHTDTVSKEVMAETAKESRRHNLPVTIHTAINVPEFQKSLDRYRRTPMQLLDDVGLLAPHVILGHAVLASGHSWTNFAESGDIELMGRRGATISHSPFKYLHMGLHLESLQRYVDAGVNVTIGTDFAPGDILAEARYTMLASRVADRSFLSGTPRQVFDAATVNPAKALGRDDLGRLAPGSKADVVLFDMRKMHFGAIFDPIKSLVELGSASDVELVMVDGKPLVEDGQLLNMDQPTVLAGLQSEAEKLWASMPQWTWGGRRPEDMVPPSYPMI